MNHSKKNTIQVKLRQAASLLFAAEAALDGPIPDHVLEYIDDDLSLLQEDLDELYYALFCEHEVTQETFGPFFDEEEESSCRDESSFSEDDFDGNMFGGLAFPYIGYIVYDDILCPSSEEVAEQVDATHNID